MLLRFTSKSIPMRAILSFVCLFAAALTQAQIPDHIYHENIRTVKLHKYGDIYSYPMLKLNGGEQLELHFDDLDADYKNYYYSFQLCNADWSPANLQTFDYIRGFQSTRITTYRNASLTTTRYTHYQAVLPERSSVPVRSGNYLLKVFINNDTSQLAFTKRFLVVDSRVAVAAQMMTPFNVQLSRTDQRVHISVSTVNAQINTLSPQDLRVVVLQNNIWPSAVMINRPTIYRGNYYEYNDDATTFPAGREWRWVDLRSLRLMGDRVQKIVDTANRVDVYVKPEGDRVGQIYVYYRDLNGIYAVENSDGNNPYWQSDYAHVHFNYVPPGRQAYGGKDVYVFGELTNYSFDDNSRLTFNAETGSYQGSLLLKQGYYNYSYVIIDPKAKGQGKYSFAATEGNFNSTENTYSILVYYRPFGGRADELLGYAQLNSVVLR